MTKCAADSQSACKPAHRSSDRQPSPFERFAGLATGGAVLMMTACFGRSPVREAAYRLHARCPDLSLKLSWRLFSNLEDWGKRWPTEQHAFAAGLILSATGDPVVERAVGRCLIDLARLGRPLLWGVVGSRLRWHPRFIVRPNGWLPEAVLPHPASYARLYVRQEITDFRPRFDPILFSLTQPDFFISGSRLRWLDERHFPLAVCHE